jgi:D-alanyl-D-alanine carboxypeptidase (penicillin-binding protein 5/6)
MIQPVLQPVRRRRRRIRWPRVLAALLVLSAAAGLGVYLGTRHSSPEPAAAARAGGSKTPTATHQRVRAPARPERLVVGPPLSRAPLSPPLTARSAIVVEAGSGRVVWARRPHLRLPIASTTKIMTALLALRKLRPHDVVVVDPSATRVPLVREGLRPHEHVQAWKLFYGLLLYSGNDDALALAIAAGGSRPAFVHEMNAEARRLGLRDSHFRSPSGVQDEDNYSSAWDLAGLTRVAMRNPRFRKIVRTRRREVPWSAPTYAKVYVNKNLMLTRYPGANGVKTGFTTKAGQCLVASATRRGVTLVAVVLHSADEYGEATRLLNLGFGSIG